MTRARTGELVEFRRHRATWAAPRRPKVDEHRRLRAGNERIEVLDVVDGAVCMYAECPIVELSKCSAFYVFAA